MTSASNAAHQSKIGPIWLSPGVRRREILLFTLVVGFTASLVSFFALMQPFVLSEVMHVPAGQQGRISGNLYAVQQASVLLFVGIAGALADRWGRKVMIAFAVAGFSAIAFVYPFVTTVIALACLQAFLGFVYSSFTAGAPTKMLDYPDEASRGKFIALMLICNSAMTVVLVGGLASHMPTWLHQAGLSVRDAGHWSFWSAGSLAVGAAVLCLFGMRPDHAAVSRPSAAKASLRQVGAGFTEMLRYTRVNPVFALLMVTGFIIRADVTVMQTFISLWVVNAGHNQGLTTIQGIKIAGVLTGIIFTAYLVLPPVFGFLADRVNRVVFYVAAMGLVGVALFTTNLVHSVSAWPIYAVITFIGVAETAQTVSQQALLGQEAPPHLRGTAMGLLVFTGTASVVVVSAVSGFLFDKVGYTAPFVLAGVLHVIFLAIGLAILARMRRTQSRLARSETGAQTLRVS